MKVEIGIENIDEEEASSLMDEFRKRYPRMMDYWISGNTEAILKPNVSYIAIRLTGRHPLSDGDIEEDDD